jgi:hypothetical protein
VAAGLSLPWCSSKAGSRRQTVEEQTANGYGPGASVTSSDRVVAPLIVVDDEGGFEFFRSVDAAADFIPGVEVDLWSEYEWYDSEGRRLTVREEPPPRGVSLGPLTFKVGEGRAAIRPDAARSDSDELARRLREWLHARGVDVGGRERLSLRLLIEIGIHEAGFVA